MGKGKTIKWLKKVKIEDSEEKPQNFENGSCMAYGTEVCTQIFKSGETITDSNSILSNGDNVNIPTITDEYDFPQDDERMLNRLLFLSEYLNGKHKPYPDVSEQEFEDMKWETINETYCLITVDLPRKKAELVRKYFRRLDTTYAKQDGTYYSKVSKGELAKEVIEDLIEIYPWHETDDVKVNVNWSGFRKSEEDEYRTAQAIPSEKSGDFSHGLYGDNLKYAIGNLSKSVEKLNEILSGK